MIWKRGRRDGGIRIKRGNCMSKLLEMIRYHSPGEGRSKLIYVSFYSWLMGFPPNGEMGDGKDGYESYHTYILLCTMKHFFSTALLVVPSFNNIPPHPLSYHHVNNAKRKTAYYHTTTTTDFKKKPRKDNKPSISIPRTPVYLVHKGKPRPSSVGKARGAPPPPPPPKSFRPDIYPPLTVSSIPETHLPNASLVKQSFSRTLSRSASIATPHPYISPFLGVSVDHLPQVGNPQRR